ncbi:hypothetical protein [Methylobrevis pamukkalensis]|uniref:Uncharacterized protein n=1 Tax=Methylobrevis pamukkalensis TaxID=1439726 RepID=A0A1E3H6Z7_9HYPH|nr:hypothetical protein [Methylobrevis pamukkalensis]ODN72092.1 hypothetical protein A6302_00607 [Methylobrevis pamukkalensis]
MGVLFRALLLGQVTRLKRQASILIALNALMGVMLLFAVMLGIVAGTIALAQTYGAIHACLMVGGGFLAVAILVKIVIMIVRRRMRRENRLLTAVAAPTIAASVAGAQAMGGKGLGKLPVIAVVGAVVLGIFAARR